MDLKNWKIIVIVLLSLAVIFKLLGAIVFAVVIAFLAKPIFDFLNKLTNSRAVSAFIITIGVLLLILFPVAIVIQSLVSNSNSITGFVSEIAARIGGLMKGVDSGAINSLINTFTQKLIAAFGDVLIKVPKGVIDLFVMLTLVYYFLKDGPGIKKYIYSVVEDEKEIAMLNELENLLSAIIIGSVAAALVIGIISYAIFLILGLKFAVIFAVIIGLTALIPIIGPWIVYIPLVAYEILIKDYRMAAAVGIAGIFVQFLEIYLGPKLSSHISKIHPAILILGFLGGPLLLGIKGIILGPLILGAAKIIFENYRK